MLPSMRQPNLDTAPSQGDATPRELRAQLVKRLQVGLFGLSFMLLLVGLANIIMEHARRNDATVAAQSTTSGATANAAGATDPLADIGVVPSPDPTAGKRGAVARPAPAPAH